MAIGFTVHQNAKLVAMFLKQDRKTNKITHLFKKSAKLKYIQYWDAL